MEESILLGNFDKLILFLLIAFNVFYFLKKRELNLSSGCSIILVWSLIFGIVLPIISMSVEFEKVKNENEIVDGFNMLYTFFRFPTYWLIGLLEYFIIWIMHKK